MADEKEAMMSVTPTKEGEEKATSGATASAAPADSPVATTAEAASPNVPTPPPPIQAGPVTPTPGTATPSAPTTSPPSTSSASALSASTPSVPPRTVLPSKKYTPPSRPSSSKLPNTASQASSGTQTEVASPQQPAAGKQTPSQENKPATPKKGDKQTPMEVNKPDHLSSLTTTPARPQAQPIVRPVSITPRSGTQNGQPAREQAAQKGAPKAAPAPAQQPLTAPAQPVLQAETATPQLWGKQAREQIMHDAMSMSLAELPTGHLSTDITQDLLPDNLEEWSASLAATSRAAERWRTSWLDRQHVEAGPATTVSRGQASVPQPLQAMQHSLARMRAILMPKQQKQNRATAFRFWVTVFLIVCLIGGLAAYVISTYLPNARFAATVAPSTDLPTAVLTLQGQAGATLSQGQSFKVKGNYFGSNDVITFVLDTTTAITNAGGKQVSVHSDSQGGFTATLTVGNTWTAGPHLIQAQDMRTSQRASLNIQVNLGSTPVTSSNKIALFLHGKRIKSVLTFTATVGQQNPDGVQITITNTSGSKLPWNVTAIADNNLNWLVLDKANTQGVLDMAGQDVIDVGIIANSLSSKPTPYTGELIFTLNRSEQLTLPVQLQVQYSQTEMVVNPNPVIAYLKAGGTCQPGLTLTLINIGNNVITWDIKPSSSTQQGLILFAGKPDLQGLLAATGQKDDTVVIDLSCTGVHAGETIPLRVGYNGLSQTVPIEIQG